MRILHTSDWHLGKILCGEHLTEDQDYVLQDFLRLVKDVKPHAVVIAGDLYDRSVPPVEAVELLDEVLSKIVLDISTPVIAISGNHDSGDRVAFASRFLKDKGLYITGKIDGNFEPITLQDDYGNVDFYSLPYVEPAIVKEKFKDENIRNHDQATRRVAEAICSTLKKSQRNVFIGHMFASGGSTCDSERSLSSVGGAEMVDVSCLKDFNYVALGHLHKPQKISAESVRYSGSLLKYSFSEADHNKNVCMIDMDAVGNIKIEEIKLRNRRDLRCITGTIDEILKGPQDGQSSDDYVKITLTDNGLVYNAMNRIRKMYPNALEIEFTNISPNREGKISGIQGDFRKLTDVDIFKSFYKQVKKEQEPSLEYIDAFKEILNTSTENRGEEM